ncbi:hypothetical protein CH63R_09635 [Colletotrichum higginsianum IMI 349063]|uniref:Uncharacterized protein n=1 Tax=Colletotrichum higginsianum (strain IMI 349063) TaxID=759273 RepID=A0A1B7Y7Y9_COLHI|nr:hypothetical protein CH63R_09635 [Colletotrichum higginsianum IMI 349063]OBR08114.1 hypothetical protein CH63R_09635 [Colletotrichum higginsianum IMI 349063]
MKPETSENPNMEADGQGTPPTNSSSSIRSHRPATIPSSRYENIDAAAIPPPPPPSPSPSPSGPTQKQVDELVALCRKINQQTAPYKEALVSRKSSTRVNRAMTATLASFVFAAELVVLRAERDESKKSKMDNKPKP